MRKATRADRKRITKSVKAMNKTKDKKLQRKADLQRKNVGEWIYLRMI